jgi:hypothetical protein
VQQLLALPLLLPPQAAAAVSPVTPAAIVPSDSSAGDAVLLQLLLLAGVWLVLQAVPAGSRCADCNPTLRWHDSSRPSCWGQQQLAGAAQLSCSHSMPCKSL